MLTDQVGITGGENSILGALSWDGSFVLSPGNTMKVMLSSLQQRDFEMAYTLVAYNDRGNRRETKHECIFVYYELGLGR